MNVHKKGVVGYLLGRCLGATTPYLVAPYAQCFDSTGPASGCHIDTVWVWLSGCLNANSQGVPAWVKEQSFATTKMGICDILLLL